MGGEAVHVCVLSVGLDDLTRRQQRDALAVARVLAEKKRFSVFEATANDDIARTMDRLVRSGWFEFDAESVGYPWTKVALTELGKRALAGEPVPLPGRRRSAPAERRGAPSKTRIRHKVGLISQHGDTSALCFKRPRAIDMRRETWTTVDEHVTCQRCLKAIATRKQEVSGV